MMNRCIHDLLRDRASLTPDAIAVLAPDRAPMNYRALLHQAEYVARALAGHGVRPGDRVAIVLPNGPEMAVCFLAVAAMASCAPLNPAYRESEFELYFDDLRPKALIVAAGLATPARDVARGRGVPIIELEVKSTRPAGAFSLAGDEPAAVAASFAGPADTALVLHTSGTTSRPKMVPLSNANLCCSAEHIARSLGLDATDRCLNVMPLFHIHGLIGAVLSTVSAGGSIVCVSGFMAPRFFGWLDEFKPSWYTAVPTIHRDALARGAQLATPLGRTSLRLIRSCSAPMPPRLIADVEAFFGVPVVEAYGMTEASHQIACNPLPPAVRKPGSVGVPTGTKVAIMGERGDLLGSDQIGEIVVQGDGLTAGYANNPEANAAGFADGWFRTGDQGRIDGDGYVFLTGRTKEIINRGGAKIAPREVDEALMAHPAVAEAIAFALPDTRLGEDVGAAVVLRRDMAVDERGLREFAARSLADYKLPRRIVFLDQIPKGPTGKPQRIGLAEKLGLGPTDVEPLKEAAPLVPPRTPIEERLAALWRQTLRLDRIGIRDNFFDSGGDSLSAAILIMVIGQALGVELVIGDLFEAPTIEALAGLVGVTSGSRRSRLVRVQPAGGRPPFFCIGAGPTMRALGMRLAPDQPFLSPQYPDFERLPHPCRLEDIAAHHLATIRAEQPEGPYYLGGWCVDGLVAYEVGRQLRAQGQEVGLVVLFDVPSPVPPGDGARSRAAAGKAADLAEKLRLHARVLGQLRWRAMPNYVVGRVRAVARLINRKALQLHYGVRLRLKMPAVVRNELAVQHRAAQLYQPMPSDCPLLVVRRTLRPGGRQRDAKAGWDQLAMGPLDVVEIPGDHRDMFLEPQVATTAAALDAALREAQAATLPPPANTAMASSVRAELLDAGE